MNKLRKIDFTIKLDDSHSTITNYASHIVFEASKYMSNMTLSADNSTVDLKSILGVVSLGMYEGKKATIIINGEDEDIAYEKLNNLLTKNV